MYEGLSKTVILAWQGESGSSVFKFVWHHLWMISYAINLGGKSIEKYIILIHKFLFLLLRECSSCQLMAGPLCYKSRPVKYRLNICLHASSRFTTTSRKGIDWKRLVKGNVWNLLTATNIRSSANTVILTYIIYELLTKILGYATKN